jgi:hypothetical protein
MAAQRPAGLVPALRGRAGVLPLRDASVDAAMAVLSVHHWDEETEDGVRELRRVARGPVVIVTFDVEVCSRMWLAAEYLPEVTATDRRTFHAAAAGRVARRSHACRALADPPRLLRLDIRIPLGSSGAGPRRADRRGDLRPREVGPWRPRAGDAGAGRRPGRRDVGGAPWASARSRVLRRGASGRDQRTGRRGASRVDQRTGRRGLSGGRGDQAGRGRGRRAAGGDSRRVVAGGLRGVGGGAGDRRAVGRGSGGRVARDDRGAARAGGGGCAGGAGGGGCGRGAGLDAGGRAGGRRGCGDRERVGGVLQRGGAVAGPGRWGRGRGDRGAVRRPGVVACGGRQRIDGGRVGRARAGGLRRGDGVGARRQRGRRALLRGVRLRAGRRGAGPRAERRHTAQAAAARQAGDRRTTLRGSAGAGSALGRSAGAGSGVRV